jgi:enterochelin esterase-like enzyme
MKHLVPVVAFILATTASSQPVVSPEVHSDGRVTFRFNAPKALDVVLHCESIKDAPMQKDNDGVWSITTTPLQPDIYVYSFRVDGLRVIDPANPFIKFNLLEIDSQVHVPGPAGLPWEINDVPHGVIHRHFYRSAVVGNERPFLVYTPPGYDPAAPRPYPALYLLHGYSDAEDTWTTVGRANVILDNLIARGQAKPMVVVMPLGYGNQEVLAGGWAGVQRKAVKQDSDVKFRDALLNEVMPQVEQTYRVSPGPTAHAIAGLSMGGRQSLFIGLNATDRFAWIGAFSSGGLNPDFAAAYPSAGENTNARLRLLWIACGTEDDLIGINRNLDEWLTAKGVRHAWIMRPGAHSFRVWRRLLAEFAPLLFQDQPP